LKFAQLTASNCQLSVIYETVNFVTINNRCHILIAISATVRLQFLTFMHLVIHYISKILSLSV